MCIKQKYSQCIDEDIRYANTTKKKIIRSLRYIYRILTQARWQSHVNYEIISSTTIYTPNIQFPNCTMNSIQLSYYCFKFYKFFFCCISNGLAITNGQPDRVSIFITKKKKEKKLSFLFTFEQSKKIVQNDLTFLLPIFHQIALLWAFSSYQLFLLRKYVRTQRLMPTQKTVENKTPDFDYVHCSTTQKLKFFFLLTSAHIARIEIFLIENLNKNAI